MMCLVYGIEQKLLGQIMQQKYHSKISHFNIARFKVKKNISVYKKLKFNPLKLSGPKIDVSTF